MASHAQAQVTIDGSVPVKVRHITHKIQVGDAPEQDLKAKTTIRQSHQSPLSLTLVDRNPFLFTYEAKTVEQENEQHKIVAGFAEQLAALAKLFGAAGGAKLVQPRVIEGLDAAATVAAIERLRIIHQSVPGLIGQSLSSAPGSREQVQQTVRAWNLEEVEKILNGAFKAAFEISVKCLVAGEKDQVLTLGDARVPCGTSADGASKVTIKDFATSVLTLRPGIEGSLAILKLLAADAVLLTEPLPLAELDPSVADRVVTLTIKASPKYESLLTPELKKRREAAIGEYAFLVTLSRPARYSFGPAFMLKLREDRTYTAVKRGDQFGIKREDDGIGYNLAAMLNVTPTKWANPSLAHSFQIGATPEKDNAGIFGGYAATLEGLISIGVGVSWQQVTRLDGLNETDTLAAPEDLKVHHPFRVGGYILISVPVIKKK